jgi:hypothetical protein
VSAPAGEEGARVETYGITWATTPSRDLLQVGERVLSGEKVQPPHSSRFLLFQKGPKAMSGLGQETAEEIAGFDRAPLRGQSPAHRLPSILWRGH